MNDPDIYQAAESLADFWGSRIASPTELAELAMNNGHSLSDAWVMSAIATGIIAERIERDLAAEERRHKWQN